MKERPIHLVPLDTQSKEYDQLLAELTEFVSGFGLTVEDDGLELCLQHLMYVIQVNEYINLTRITDIHEALVLHILDSLTLLPYIPSESVKVLDMGTGAGFPGIPLAACTELDITLLDSVGKKIKADNAIIRQLGLLNVHGEHDRLESFACSHRDEYDVVVARALASLPMLIEYATPFLSDDGVLLVSKGNPSEDELNAGKKAAEICGLKLEQCNSFDLPNALGHRQILLFRKIGVSSIKLPRAIGEAKRNPLA